MTGLVGQYGYGDEGESFSIADTREAWILEMTGIGSGGKGTIWSRWNPRRRDLLPRQLQPHRRVPA